MEELLLLWLANINPVFKPFKDLFDDTALKTSTAYKPVTAKLPEYFASRPPLSPEAGSLLDALKAPMLASPDSLTGQLDYIREHWAEYLGADLKRVLLAIDTLREEDIAIWMRFNPARPEWYRHGQPGAGHEGFVGDEYVGFDDAYEWVTGADGTRQRVRKYDKDYQAPLNEYEAFSADQAWMPNVVLMAKSTYVWLEQLSKKYQRHIHRLDQVPQDELKMLAERGITSLWLIGLWERSTASRTIKHLRGHGDAVASAYSLKSYDIAEDLGGNYAYEQLRENAARAGLRLASDMVPNHMGIDSDWVIDNPDWFLFRDESPYPVYQFNGPDLSTDSRVEIKLEDHYYDQTDAAVVFRIKHHRDGRTRYMYHGNDGTTFAWNDTAQLDYSKAFVREQVIQAILHVAKKFPIIRFDAAMVLAKRHVQRLWFPLPGAGGSIPSRAEDAISQEQFDALMPVEFWREVVDRVAVEVPGTLLLAEAFWMLEGYFVRTLGMHRVYNSAFMNMLRDEENAKYRSYLKKTIEFDPDIMKRYVNFMSNPDERTAIDQFGDGDKCFGVATMMSTLPGLPMFGHGQIEGYTERYGMEYKAAKMEEWPRQDLVDRHMREIAPLLKKRYIFAESENFVLYDFWHENGGVDENVFAYSNRFGNERSIVLYNNAYNSTKGTIHTSAGSMNKATGELWQRTITQGLALPDDGDVIMAFRDPVRGLEFLRRSTDFREYGLTLDLRGYQYAVLLDWRELRSTAEQPWSQLCDALHGSGVKSVDEALRELRLRPVHSTLRDSLTQHDLTAFAEKASATKQAEEDRFGWFVEKGLAFFDRATEILAQEGVEPKAANTPAEKVKAKEAETATEHEAAEPVAPMSARDAFAAALLKASEAVAMVATVQPEFAECWPPCVTTLLPGSAPGTGLERNWAPALAFVLTDALVKGYTDRLGAFDRLHLREALAEVFSGLDISGQDAWRYAARVRMLLAYGETPVAETFASQAFWDEGDVRWLGGVNESEGTLWFNKESVEELLVWLELPSLLTASGDLEAIEVEVTSLRKAADGAGYRVAGLNGLATPEEKASAAPLAELKVESTAKPVEEEVAEPTEDETETSKVS